MLGEKKMKEVSYNLFFIPEDHSGIKKVRLSERQIRLAVGGSVAVFFFFVFHIVGFWYYHSLYRSLQKDRLAVMAYEQEKKEIMGKVLFLEKAVGETEKLVGKLASLVGPQRVQLEKGIGPIPGSSFDVAAKTASVSLTSLEPKLERLEDRTLNLQSKIRELHKIQEDKLIYIASTPSIWPVKGWVTSDFGYRRSPFNRRADFHRGIDIAAQWGTPILAPSDGVVTFAGRKGGYGNTVILDHGFGITTHYGHTSQILVQEGQKVIRGGQIAHIGTTGHSTGPHLHYEIHVDGVPVDPMKYILQ